MGEVIRSTATENTFHWISTILSLVMGLGATRLLSGLIIAFRMRRAAPLDWLPVAWAGIIFLAMVQFWWAIHDLPGSAHTLGFATYTLLVGLILLLFASAGLLLPAAENKSHTSLRGFFQDEGRYGLLALAGYYVLALFANVALFHADPASREMLVLVPMLALPIMAFFAGRKLQVAITLIYVLLAVYDAVVAA